MTIVKPKDLNEGDASTEDNILIQMKNYDGLNLYILPEDSEIWWSSQSGDNDRRVDVVDFNEWQVTKKHPDFIEITLDNDVVIKALGIGVIVFTNLTTEFSFQGTTQTISGNRDEPRQINDGDWWVSSDDKWSLDANGSLTAESTARISIFYNERGDEQWLHHLVKQTNEDLRLAGTHIERLARALRLGYWTKVDTGIEQMRRDMFVASAERGALGQHARALNLERKPDEKDSRFRVRIFGEIKRKIGGSTRDDVINFVEAIVNAQTGEVTVDENKDSDTGEYNPGYYEVDVSMSALKREFDEDEYTEVLDKVEDILDRVTGAGINPVVRVIDGAVYDTDDYDSGGIYGT